MSEEKQYEDVEFTFWKPEKENDFICGVYKGIGKNVGENKQNVYHLQTDSKVISIWGSTVLNGKMELVQVGDDIKIIYLGESPSGQRKGKDYHNYKVQIVKGEE